LSKGAPSYNMGTIYGRVKLVNGQGIFFTKQEWSENGCKLNFVFDEDKNLVIETILPHDDCLFGNGVYADGTFDKESNKIPDYFEDGDGSKIYFKNTKPEDYSDY